MPLTPEIEQVLQQIAAACSRLKKEGYDEAISSIVINGIVARLSHSSRSIGAAMASLALGKDVDFEKENS